MDYTAGRALRARGAGKGRCSKFKERVFLARRTTKRLRTHTDVLGRKALKISTAGPLASGTYGADVFGISDAELHFFRSLGMSTISPKSQLRSLTVISFLESDIIQICIVSLIQYYQIKHLIIRHHFSVFE